ncbi:hypothetical protein [Vibrio sonorensis]|uniref:hypothetical protein n=1 Tax=Vibrio sonorensis TaxID=1004316 RepID=UPI0008D94975|nr:hypothetical protein [Vibrio sonorensis]
MTWKAFHTKSVMARYTAQAAFILLACSLIMGSILLVLNTKYQVSNRYDTAQQQLSGLSNVLALSLYNVDPVHTQTIVNGLDAYDLYSDITVKDVTDISVAHIHWSRHQEHALYPLG